MITSPQGEPPSKVVLLFAPEFSLYALFPLWFILYVDKMKKKKKKSFFKQSGYRGKFGPRNSKVEYHISKFKYSVKLLKV